jgi:putative membrane protein
MKTRTMLKKLNLTPPAFDEIRTVVGSAESKTTGEIALVLTKESAHYAFWELLASISFTAFVFVVMLPFAGRFNALYERITWTQRIWALPAFYGVVCLFMTIGAFYLCNVPAVDRIVIPRKVQASSVTRHALRCFTETGVYETMEHSGILIFVSYLEHQVRIVADKGISQKIPQDLWNIIADDLSAEIKIGHAKEGFISAVEKCGELLAEHFPAHTENPNELPDGLIVQEDEEWY